ncbi:MAG: lipid-A-disaccharide synthase [Bacteroidales bacterium]|nr:lipid-A-disaccharide synthase [Bacteroidales bacterium]
MKYFIITGEPSGDLHASNLIKTLRTEDAQSEFQYWGGDKMQEASGIKPLKHINELAFMGFLEVVQNIFTIFRNFKLCKQQLLEFKPDVLILVDYPGFNLKMAKFAHKKGIRVFYYISPKIWAWKQKRVYTIKENVERMFTILPFETAFYEKFGVTVDYIGNPLMDAIQKHKDQRSTNTKPQKTIALLPGSRKQELQLILPDMLQVIKAFPDYRFVLAATHNLPKELYKELIGNNKVELILDETYKVLDQAEAALVASGTATLETALLNIPQVVCYKANPISYTIAKNLVSIKYISLVNLIMDQEIVVELVQHDLNFERISKELSSILIGGEKRENMLSNYALMQQKVGPNGASERAAKLMVKYLNNK